MTWDQIRKDLGGLIDVPELEVDVYNNPYQQLHTFVIAALEELSRSTANSFVQFIYKVDLNESKFGKIIDSGSMSELADLIIRREAQKVFFKLHLRPD